MRKTAFKKAVQKEVLIRIKSLEKGLIPFSKIDNTTYEFFKAPRPTGKIKFAAVPKVLTVSLKVDFEVMEAFACKEDQLPFAIFSSSSSLFTLKLAGCERKSNVRLK